MQSDRSTTDDWWDCPNCGAETETTIEDATESDRECPDCDWSVRIPRPHDDRVTDGGTDRRSGFDGVEQDNALRVEFDWTGGFFDHPYYVTLHDSGNPLKLGYSEPGDCWYGFVLNNETSRAIFGGWIDEAGEVEIVPTNEVPEPDVVSWEAEPTLDDFSPRLIADGGTPSCAAYHPEEKRPRMEVEVVDTSVSASAEAVTRPVVGKDHPQRKGEVTMTVRVTVKCPCGKEVTVYSDQGVTCQCCGRRWSV